jgi:S1-C subfamily serine protease
MHKSTFTHLLVFVASLVVLLPTLCLAGPQDSMVKVFTTATTYNYDTPWQVSGVEQWSGSGCIISGKRILTNAHVVSNAAYIEVLRYGDSNKYTATVIAVSHEADLALLQVTDEAFFADTIALELGELPELQDGVVVYGFPEGGEGLSVTKGIISRIEITQYVHSRLHLLGLQIDAAINAGNSGGPVIKDGRIVGVAMQILEKAQNIGYIIPVPIIEHFLTDLKDGHHNGFPEDGIVIQGLENSIFRETLGLPPETTGVYIAEVVPGTSSDGYLTSGDVILNVDGHSVANDGSVLLRPGLRIQSDYYITQHQMGDQVEMTIWRNGVRKNLSIPLTSRQGSSQIVKLMEYDLQPEYYILAGIILTPLSYNYLASWGEDWSEKAPIKLLKYFYQFKGKADEQVVIVSGLLTSKMTTGYQNAAGDTRVVSVNGQSFTCFKELTVLLDQALTRDDPITLKTEDNAVIVVSPHEHRKNEKELLKLYGIDEPKRVR